MKKVLPALFFLLAIASQLYAQDYTFESLTVEDGLSQSSVTCIAQDEKGFLWIGTRDGLNRYDGKEVTNFRKIPFDTNSLQSNIITCLLIDDQNSIYVGTTKGLQRYDQSSKSFTSIRLTNDGGPVYVLTLYKDRNDLLWAGSNSGFFSIRPDDTNGQFLVTPYLYQDPDGEKASLGVYSFLHDRNNEFWVSTSSGVLKSSYAPNEQSPYKPEISGALITNQPILGLQELPSGEIIGIGTSDIYAYRQQQDVFFPISDRNINDPYARLAAVDQGQYWTTGNTGISFFTLNENAEISGEEIALPFFGLAHSRHKINFVLKDKIYDDFYWLATDLGGVMKMYKRKKKFNTSLLKNIPNLDVTNPYLRHITTTGDNVWLNLGIGILLYQRNKGRYQLLNDFFPPNSNVSANTISSIYRSQSNKIYATLKGEIVELHLDQNDHVQILKHPIDQIFRTENNTVVETKTHFIRGGRSGLISILQKETLREVAHFKPSFPDQSTEQIEITSLLLDKQSNLWVGSTDGLLIYPNFIPGYERTQEPIILQYNSDDTSGLMENRITALFQDSRGLLWICTRNGLMSAKLTDRKIDLTQVDNAALNNKVLYGILEDKNSYQFWLSSNHGLYRFDPTTQRVDNFDFHDGLQGNEFNSYSYYQSDAGEMFFGGPNGFTSFFPDEIAIDTTLPPIWITSLTTTNNQHYNLLASDTSAPLHLDFSQRSFSIKFIGLNYLGSTDLMYFYNLQGTTSLSGVPLGTSQQVNFSQLDPGSYTLEIYSEDRNGQKNAKKDTLHFVVEAPFWRMPWFFILMTILVAFIGWLLFYLRYQNKLKQLKAVDQVRKNISEDFHDELGSKLSIISMYSEFTKQQLGKDNTKAATYLDKVNDTASRLYENTRDLIWALNPQNDSLYDLFLQLKDFGEEMFQDTEIEFHSAGLAETWKDKNLPMRFKRHLLLIFKEGMHNALKHSGCKMVKLRIDEKDSKLIIMLQDDGIGFDATTEHKGDGLKNMAERAKHLHGGLNFISKKEGTRIWMELSNELLK